MPEILAWGSRVVARSATEQILFMTTGVHVILSVLLAWNVHFTLLQGIFTLDKGTSRGCKFCP